MCSYYLSDGQIADVLEKIAASEEINLEEFDFFNFLLVDYTVKTKGCRFQVVETITFKVISKDPDSKDNLTITIRIGEKDRTVETLQFMAFLL